MTAIEKKSKVKYWKFDFLFIHRESGWGNILDWNEANPVRNSLVHQSRSEEDGPLLLLLRPGGWQVAAYPKIPGASDRVSEGAWEEEEQV